MQRFRAQQNQIANGIANGSLTPGEAARLEFRQQRILNADTRFNSDGTLSPQEIQRLDRLQDRADRRIARETTDNQSVNLGNRPVLNAIQQNVANGIRNETLTPAQAALIERAIRGRGRGPRS